MGPSFLDRAGEDKAENLRQTGKIRQDIASDLQAGTEQYEQPESPVEPSPLPGVPRADYQEQGEAETTDLGYGIQ